MDEINTTSEVTQAEMAQYVTTTIDTFFKPLYNTLQIIKSNVDKINGEQSTLDLYRAIKYLDGTKTAIRDAIINAGVNVPIDATFRSYADYIAMIKISAFTPTVNIAKKVIQTIDIVTPSFSRDAFSDMYDFGYTIKRAKYYNINTIDVTELSQHITPQNITITKES